MLSADLKPLTPLLPELYSIQSYYYYWLTNAFMNILKSDFLKCIQI